jgi:hypothetical protein
MDAVARLFWLRGIAADPATSEAPLRVAIALACRHNGRSGQLNPAVSTLAGDTGMAERSVRRALSWLESAGHIVVERSSGGCSTATNQYRLVAREGLTDELPLTDESGLTPDPLVTPGLTDESPLPLTGGFATPDPLVRSPLTGESSKQGIEQVKEKYRSATARAVDGSRDDEVGAGKQCGEGYKTKKGRVLAGEQLAWFNEFWAAFDFRKGKAEAADAWLDLKVDSSVKEQIVRSAAHEARNRTKPGERGPSPKWAQGWLSGRRWEDEPEEQGRGRTTGGSDWITEVGL